ncbi:MAG: acyl-CoA dehydrogenase family protein [Thermoplasmatota archaeon]
MNDARAAPERGSETVASAKGSLEDVLATARRLAETVVRDEAERCDRDAVWPEASFKAVQQRGLAGLVVPRELGGHGLGLDAVAKVCEVFGRESASFGLCFGMHCVGTAVIAAKATPQQQQDYLVPIAKGEHITTLALSEPGTGSHFYFPQSTMKETIDGYLLNGAKSFVTNGGHADSYVVSALTEVDRPEPGLFSCALVRADAPGLIWGEPYEGMGMRGNAARSAALEDLQLPPEALLGGVGDQIWYVFNVVAPFFLMAMAGTYLGVANRALDETIDHLQGREYHHDGSRLGDVETLQHHLGTMWAQVDRTRALISRAANAGDEGDPDALPALCAAKAEVADCAVDVVNQAMTLMGGRTYRDGHLLGRLLRDARAAHVMAPTTDQLRIWTGRALLQVPLLGN